MVMMRGDGDDGEDRKEGEEDGRERQAACDGFIVVILFGSVWFGLVLVLGLGWLKERRQSVD
jgi:hypothetical protein